MNIRKMSLAGWIVLVLAQGNAVASPRLAMSPAGQAIFNSEYKEVQSSIGMLIRKRANTRKQIDLHLKDTHPDWKVLDSLLDQDLLDEIKIRQLSRLIDRGLLTKLSEPDRVVYLCDRFPSDIPPIITTELKH